MRLITRHILRTLAAPFFWGVAALTGLLLLQQLAQMIDKFGGRGLGLEVMVEAIILALPALLTLTLPMSVLVATLYAYSTLAADLEMVAMYANGISVWRMVRPALLAAVVVATVNFLLFDQVVPLSNTRFRTLSNDVFRKTPTLSLRAQQLNELRPTGYLIWAHTVETETGRLQGVRIWDMRRQQGRRVIHADSARMAQSPNGRDLNMTLYYGEQFDFSSPEPGHVEHTTFKVNRIRIPDAIREFERSQGQTTRGDRERSGCELLDRVGEYEWTAGDGMRQLEYLTRRDLHHLIGETALPPPPLQARPEFEVNCTGVWRTIGDFFKELLLPVELEAEVPPRLAGRLTQQQDSLERLRVTPLQGVSQGEQQQEVMAGSDSATTPLLFGQDSLARAGGIGFLVDPNQVAPTARPSGVISSMIEVFGARAQLAGAVRGANEYEVEYHKKFAIPLASFCFVLLGVALALKFPRSGIGLVIGASLLVFLAFYVMLIGGESLADNGVVSPKFAMYAPVALFTLLGLIATAGANREMGTARSSGIVDWLVGLLRRLGKNR